MGPLSPYFLLSFWVITNYQFLLGGGVEMGSYSMFLFFNTRSYKLIGLLVDFTSIHE